MIDRRQLGVVLATVLCAIATPVLQKLTLAAQVQLAEADESPADALKPANAAAIPDLVRNPLQGFFQRLFNRGGRILPGRFQAGAPAAGRRRPAEGEPPPRVSPSDRDYIDSRAPHDARVEHQLRLAQTAIKKNDWKQAVILLQHLLDLPEDSLHRQDDGSWQSVRTIAGRELGRAPQAVLETYQQQNGGLAKQLFADAQREGDVAGVIRVATRFFHTEAGYQAADYLAMVHQDRAEFGMAAQWLDQLLTARTPLVRTTAWRLKAAAIYRHAGRTDAAEAILNEFTADSPAVQIGGVAVAARTWFDSLPGETAIGPLEQTDWRQLNGTSDRTGLQAGGAPFLLAEWQTPYSSSHAVRQRIDWMLQELTDQNRPLMLSGQPLAIGGKGIYRDLRGVRVIELETGASLWESIEGVSAERIATGITTDSADVPAPAMPDFQDPFGGQSGENHPLINLMLRDSAYNTLSSDGRQVFLIEDQGILSRQHPGFHWGWDGDQSDQYGFTWLTNRLASYDLETGRPLWTVGGPETTESFQLPMAGVYFHGVPTPDGDDLFVIGSKGDEVRLWCLDRRTGGRRWSQLIGYSDTKIDQDIVRRWMAALPSVSEGIVVCPTTIGWLVAVDRLRQSVLWAVRYSPVAQGMEYSTGTNIAQFQELGGSWGVGAPVIVGQRVLYTPPEDNLLVCLDLVTGKQHWQLPRENGQYLAGATRDRIFIVELGQVASYDMADGKKLWTADIGDQALPSGRAALTAEHLYLPLSTGELRVLQLSDGATTLRTFVPSGEPPLGNLVLHDGRMVSLGPQGCAGFRQQAALLADIQRRKAADPADPTALIHEAEIQLLNREAEQALALLRQVKTDSLSDELRVRHHADSISGLTAMIRQNLAASEQELAELERISASPVERLLHLDLSAERFLTLGRHEQAFDLYWKLTSEPAEGFVTRTDDAKVLVQRPAWLSGRLKDVWSAADESARTQIDRKIADAASEAAGAEVPEQRRLAALLGFHPVTRNWSQQLIDARLQAGESTIAELELLRLVESGDSQQAAWATWKLVELLERLQLSADAAEQVHRLETDYGTVTLADGRTGAQLAAELRASGRTPVETAEATPAWDERPLKVTQLPHVNQQPNQEVFIESRLPFFNSLNLEYLPREQRLSFESRRPDGFRWLAPLRSSMSSRHNGYVAAQTLGHATALVHQDVLHVLSPVGKETLWSVPLDGLADGGLPPTHADRRTLAPMWSVQQQDGMDSPLFQDAGENGRLAVVQTGYIAVSGRRTIHVLDSRTGAEIWRRTNIPPESKVLGGPDMLWIIPPGRQHCLAYRVSDGTPVAVHDLDKLLGKTIGLVGNDFLLAESGVGLKLFVIDLAKTILRRHDPLTKTDVWKQEFKPNSMLSRLSEEELLVVQSSGAVERVQLSTGARQPLESLTAKDLQSRSECYALADERRIYVIVNTSTDSGYHHFAESLPSVRAHGTIFAWDRSSGRQIWKQALKDQHLIVDHFRAAPVLLFCSREWKQRGNVNFSELSLLLLHKESGRVLHESSTPTMYNGFQSLAILPKEQAVELRSYNMRMRLSPADQPADKGSD